MNNSINPENISRQLDNFVEPDTLEKRPVYLIADKNSLELTDNARLINSSTLFGTVVIAKISPLNLDIKEILLNIPVWEPERWRELRSKLPKWLVKYVEKELK